MNVDVTKLNAKYKIDILEDLVLNKLDKNTKNFFLYEEKLRLAKLLYEKESYKECITLLD